MFEQDGEPIGTLPQVNECTMRQTMRDPQLETLLTARQVSDFLQVSIATVRRWSGSGMLKCYRVGSRGDRRYRREDVIRFVEEPSSYSHTGSAKENVALHPHPNEETRHRRKSRPVI